MKSLIHAAVAASLLAIPAMTFAQQSNGPVTRAQVRAELIELEQAGYQPGRANNPFYPADIQAAERIVQQRHEALAQREREATGAAKAGAAAVTDESYGGKAAEKSEAGAPTDARGTWQHGAMPCSMDPKCGLYRGH